MARNTHRVIGKSHSSAELFSFVEQKVLLAQKKSAANRSLWRVFEDEEIEDKNITGAPSSARFGRKTADSRGGAGVIASSIGGNAKQAIVKVISFGRGQRSVQNQLEYVAREGELDLETQDGDKIVDQDAIDNLVEEWSVDFRVGAKARNSIHMQVSTPYGSNPEAVKRAARSFAKTLFGERRDYVFVLHNDTDYPHVHIIAKTMAYDGKVINPRKNDLHAWREIWAEEARGQGIMIVASSRRDRAQSRRGEKIAVRKLKERGEVPRYYTAIAKDVLAGLPFEHASNVTAFREEATRRHKLAGIGLTQAALKARSTEERSKLLNLALKVQAQLETMKATLPLRDQMQVFYKANPKHETPQALARSFLEREMLTKTAAGKMAKGRSRIYDDEDNGSGHGIKANADNLSATGILRLYGVEHPYDETAPQLDDEDDTSLLPRGEEDPGLER